MKTNRQKNHGKIKTSTSVSQGMKGHTSEVEVTEAEIAMLTTSQEADSGELKEAEIRARYSKWYKTLTLQDKRYLQQLKWYDDPDTYREWCEVGHEITMLCQMLDLAFQDFSRLGGDMFADLQLHKNAVKAMDKMVDHELAEWTKQGDERGEQWVSMLGAAQALRERFSIVMNYSFGDKAQWRLHEFEKVIDNAYPQSAREEETKRRHAELIDILKSGNVSTKEADEVISILKQNGRWGIA